MCCRPAALSALPGKAPQAYNTFTRGFHYALPSEELHDYCCTDMACCGTSAERAGWPLPSPVRLSMCA